VTRGTLRVKGKWAQVPTVIASSFADPADVAAYRKAIAEGKSRETALKLGDDGIGCWGDDTTEDHPLIWHCSFDVLKPGPSAF
jgi:hypothetical protein